MENFHKTLKNYFAGQGMTQMDISNRLGISPTIVSNYLNGQRDFGKLVAGRWSQTFGIDPMWLMTKGTKGTPPNGVIQFATPTTDPEVINVPVINLDVRGGLLPNEETDVEEYKVTTMPFSRNLATEGDFVVPVYGESMSPRYPSGSHILIRPLPMWREWLELGQSYVLELADHRRTIKIVRKGTAPDTYRLDCYNVDYDSTEIPVRMIEHVFQVVAVVKRETI